MLNTDTLINCVYAVRAEAGHSLSSAQGTNTVDALKFLLKRTQQDLWVNNQWPTLKIRSDVATVAGQYLYNFATGFSFEQVREVWTSRGSSYNWDPVGYGISEDLIAPGGTNTQRRDQPEAWDVSGDAQYRIWPTPNSNAFTVRFIGQRQLAAFVNDADVSTLDATLITLFVAAELLARAKAEDAGMKLQKAQQYLKNLLGNSISAKRKVSTLASGAPVRAPSPATPFIDYVPG